MGGNLKLFHSVTFGNTLRHAENSKKLIRLILLDCFPCCNQKQHLLLGAKQHQVCTAMLASVLNSQRSTAGSSPTDPIYVSPLQPTLKDRLWKLLGGTLTAFIVFSMIGSMMDEKGGIGGRLGMTGNNIRKAEHSTRL